MSEQYTIEARSFKIPNNKYLPTVAAHNFWVLKNEKNEIVAQLQGLATDRKTNEIMPIGYWDSWHSLRAYHIKNPKYLIQENQPAKVVFTGTKEDALARWNKAVAVIPAINKQDLNYPSLGVKIISNTINSNSVYQTFGEIMGLPVPEFEKGLQPGLRNNVLPEEYIQKNRYRYVPQSHLQQNAENTNSSHKEQLVSVDSETKEQHAMRDITSTSFKKAIEEAKQMMQTQYAENQTKNRSLS